MAYVNAPCERAARGRRCACACVCTCAEDERRLARATAALDRIGRAISPPDLITAAVRVPRVPHMARCLRIGGSDVHARGQ